MKDLSCRRLEVVHGNYICLWKIKIYHNEPQEAKLYNVVTNPGETDNVVDQNSEVVEMIKGFAKQARLDLGDGDGIVDHEGTVQHPAGRVENPTPR